MDRLVRASTWGDKVTQHRTSSPVGSSTTSKQHFAFRSLANLRAIIPCAAANVHNFQLSATWLYPVSLCFVYVFFNASTILSFTAVQSCNMIYFGIPVSNTVQQIIEINEITVHTYQYATWHFAPASSDTRIFSLLSSIIAKFPPYCRHLSRAFVHVNSSSTSM